MEILLLVSSTVTMWSPWSHYDTVVTLCDHYDTVVTLCDHYDTVVTLCDHYDTVVTLCDHYDTGLISLLCMGASSVCVWRLYCCMVSNMNQTGSSTLL